MTGKELFKEMRANMDEFGVNVTTKWKHLSKAKRKAWNKTANDITAGHKLIVSANKNENNSDKQPTDNEPTGTGPMGF